MRLGDLLEDADHDLKGKNKNVFMNKTYRVYMFELLNKMSRGLQDHLNKNVKRSGFRVFMDRLIHKKLEGSVANFETSRDQVVPVRSNRKAFGGRTKKKKLDQENRSQNDYTIPLLKKLLLNMVSHRKQWAFSKIRNKFMGGTVFGALTKINDRKINNAKKHFFSIMFGKYKHKKNLQGLFRSYYLYRLRAALDPMAKMNQLMYLVRVIFMNRDISSNRFMREVVRRWRFVIFMKKLAKQKMEAMYKSMHLNYLNMACEVFGDGENGMVQEISGFTEGMGLFSNVDVSEKENEKKNNVKAMVKRYQFGSVEAKNYDVNPEESQIHQEGTNNYDEGTEFYYDEGIGDATQGRYKIDSQLSNDSYLNRDRKYKK